MLYLYKMPKKKNKKITKRQKIKELAKIINTPSEYRPKKGDKKWKKVNGYYVMKGKLKYKITPLLEKKMERYSELYLSIPDAEMFDVIKKYDDNIGLIYLAKHIDSGEKYIGYTTNPLLTLIKLNLHKREVGEKDIFSKLDGYDVQKIEFRVLEYVMYKERIEIIKRRRYYKKRLLRKQMRMNSDRRSYGGSPDEYAEDKTPSERKLERYQKDDFFKKRIILFHDMLGKDKNKFKSFPGYIYMLTNKKNKKMFIGGYSEELTKKQFFDAITETGNEELKKDIEKYGKGEFKYELIEEYDAKTIIDFLLRIDFLKLRYDAFDRGYNKKYCMPEAKELFDQKLLTRIKNQLERKFFLMIQKVLVYKYFKDRKSYENIVGFVYEIQNKRNNKRFISYSHGRTLKDIIIGMYDNAIEGNVKHSKILKALIDEPYRNFTFKILIIKKTDDKEIDLQDEADKLVEKYNTIDDGYNIDKAALRGFYIRKRY